LPLPTAFFPQNIRKPRWLLWLEARHRTSLAAQQQRFEPTTAMLTKVVKGASALLHPYAAS
jgi:hypothetical protein